MRKEFLIVLFLLVVSVFSLTACHSGKRYTDDNTLVGVYVAMFDRKENGDNQLYTYEVYVQLNCDGSYNFVQKCKNPEMTKYNMEFDGIWTLDNGYYNGKERDTEQSILLATSRYKYNEDGIRLIIKDDLKIYYKYVYTYDGSDSGKYEMSKVG